MPSVWHKFEAFTSPSHNRQRSNSLAMPPVDDTNTSNSEGDNVEDEVPPEKRTTTTSVPDSDDMRASTSKLRQKRKSRRGTILKGTDRGRKRVKLDGKATKEENFPDQGEDDDEPRGTIRVAQAPNTLGSPVDRNPQPSSSGGKGRKYSRRNSAVSNNMKTPTRQTTRKTRSSMDGQSQNSTRKTPKIYSKELNKDSNHDPDSSSLSPVSDWEDQGQVRSTARGGSTAKGRAVEKDLMPKKISSSNNDRQVEIPETPQNSGPSVSPFPQSPQIEYNSLEKTVALSTESTPKPKRTLQPTDLAPTPYDPAKLTSLKFRLFRFPTKKKARNLEITGASICDPETGNISWLLLKALIERTWVTDLDHDMLLVNWFFRITKQTDLDRCVGQLCKYERPSHEIILCEQYVGPGKIPPSVTDEMIDKLRENDVNFWRGRWESIETAKPEDKMTSDSALLGDFNSATAILKKVDHKKDTTTDDASTNTKEITPMAPAPESFGIKRRPTRGASLSNGSKVIATDEISTELKENITGSSRRVTRRSSLNTLVHNPTHIPEQNLSIKTPARTSMKTMDDSNEPTPKRRAIEIKPLQETKSSSTSGKTSRRASRRVLQLEQSAGHSETEDENISNNSKVDKSTGKAALATRETSTDWTSQITPDTTHQPGKNLRGRSKRIPGSSAAPSKGALVQRQDLNPPSIHADPIGSVSTGQGAISSALHQQSVESEAPVAAQAAVSQVVIVADTAPSGAVSSHHFPPLCTEPMRFDGQSIASPTITGATQATVATAASPGASELAHQQVAENSQPGEQVSAGAGEDNDFEAIDTAAEFLLMAFMDIDNPSFTTTISSPILPSEQPTDVPNEPPQQEPKKRGRWANHIKKPKPAPKANTKSKPGRKSLTTVLKVSPGALRSATADVPEQTSEPVASSLSPESLTVEVPEVVEAMSVEEVDEAAKSVEAEGSAENGDGEVAIEVTDSKEMAPGSPSSILTPLPVPDALSEAPPVTQRGSRSLNMMSPPGTSPLLAETDMRGLGETVAAEMEIEEGQILEAPLVEQESTPAPNEPTPVPELEVEENEIEEGEIIESGLVHEPEAMDIEAEAVTEPMPIPGPMEKESTRISELVEEPELMHIKDEPVPEPDQVPLTLQNECTPAPEPELVPGSMAIESQSVSVKGSIPVSTEETSEPASEPVPAPVPVQKESQLESNPEATAREPIHLEPANTVEQMALAVSSKASVEAPVEPSKETALTRSASSTTCTAAASRAATPTITTPVAGTATTETATTETVAAVSPVVTAPATTTPAVSTPVIPHTSATNVISVATPCVTASPAVETPNVPFAPAPTVITTASILEGSSTPTTDIVPIAIPTPAINAITTPIPTTNAAPTAPVASTTGTNTIVPCIQSQATISTVASALAANSVTAAPVVVTVQTVSNDAPRPFTTGIQPPPRSAFKPAYTASPIIPQSGSIPPGSTTPKTQSTPSSRTKRKAVTLESLKPTRMTQPRNPLPTNVIPLSSLPPVPTVAPTIPRPQPYRRPGVRTSAPMLLPPKPPPFIPGGRLPPRPPSGMGPVRSSTQAPVPGQSGNPLPSRPSSQGSISSATIPAMVNGQPLNWALGEELASARKKSEEARRSPGGPLNWALGEELANARKKSEEQRRNGRLDSLRANMPRSSQPPANRMSIPRPAYGKPTEGENPNPIPEQQPIHRGNQPSYRPSISNPIGTGHSAIAHELPRPPAYVPKPRPLATSPNAPSAKMEPLVRPGNFLYQEPVSTSTTPRPLTGSSEWKLPMLERIDSPALSLTLIPGAVATAGAPQTRNSFGFPPPAVALDPPVPVAPKPNEVLFVVHRFQDPAIKLCVPGADITVDNRLAWDGLVRIISGNLQFNDTSESLVVNNTLLVKDQESLSKGFELMAYRRGPNEVVIVNVDEKGQPKEKSVLEAMEKGRKLLKEVVE